MKANQERVGGGTKGGWRSIDEKDDLRGGRGRVSRRLQVGGACESRKSRLERRFVYDEI